MNYKVKEMFYSIQGEGLNAGRAAVFLRFSGCNLWSGKEEDRHNGPSCSKWCDTDFADGAIYRTPYDLAEKLKETGPTGLLVVTGGEPLLQFDINLARMLYERGWQIALETNGTIAITPGLPQYLSHVCVSPKPPAKLRLFSGTELKLVYPQDVIPMLYETLDFEHFYLQPMWVPDGQQQKENVKACVEYVKANPKWRISLQTHKIMGVE